MSKPGAPKREAMVEAPMIRAARRLAAGLPWRSGGASVLLIAIMSAFDDSASDSDADSLGGSDGDSSDGLGSSSSDDTNTGGGGARRRGGMVVRTDGSPDPTALTDQDYRDIPSA